MALNISSEDCICTSLCGAVLGTFTLRTSDGFRHALVVNNTWLRQDAGLVAYFVGLCATGSD